MSQQVFDNMEIEHITGYQGRNYKTLYFSKGDKNQFVYCIGGIVVIEDLNDKNKQSLLRGHDMPITSLAVSNNGQYIVSGQYGSKNQKVPDAPVILWENKQQLHVFKGLKNEVTNLSFSPDDRFIAATSIDNILLIWSIQDKQVVISKQFEVSLGQILWDKVRKNGNHFSYSLITSNGSNIFVNDMEFQVATMQYTIKSQQFIVPSSGLVRIFTNSIIQDDFLFIGNTAGELLIYSISNKNLKAIVPITNQGLLSLCFVNGQLFVGSGDGKLKRLQGNGVQWNLNCEVQLNGPITSISSNFDGKELLVGTSQGKIFRVLTQTLENYLLSESHVNKVVSVAVRQQLDIFATIDDAGNLFIWNMESLQTVRKFLPQNTGQFKIAGTCVVFSDDANEVLGGYSDGFVRCFDMGQQKQKWEINAHKGMIASVFCNNMYILTGGLDGIVRVWSRTGRQLIVQYPAHSKTVTEVFPDKNQNNIIHSCSVDKTVFTFDLKNEKKVQLHQAKNGFIYAMTQRKDKEFELITCGMNIPIQFWDCDVVDPVEQIEFPFKLMTLDVSPSGRFLALGTDSGDIVIFNIQKNLYMGKYLGHSGPVNKLKWIMDEKQILSVSDDCSVSLWNFFS